MDGSISSASCTLFAVVVLVDCSWLLNVSLSTTEGLALLLPKLDITYKAWPVASSSKPSDFDFEENCVAEESVLKTLLSNSSSSSSKSIFTGISSGHWFA